ncbi:MAG TPA: cardiolipin synthase [Candidatus Lachnoclostridium pullistercoris]|uniref:Cardiolipin synthase n=1 Tax=Candidatus Lachnoclostridium pullistercoris TaxID=2838632 RepID=A0A9D2T6U8_9FIRM|nr:cardiolipin synthase [Candidatus Lachnoclostridium pullistercoris]
MEEILDGILMLWDWLMSNLIVINLVLSVIIVFFQRRDPKAVWTWLLALYFVPVFGFLFYLLLCQDLHKSKMFRIKEVEDKLNVSARSQEDYFKRHEMTLEGPMERDYKDMVIYNLETSGAVLTLNNQVTVFTDGEEKFEDLRREMRKARRFIHIQYYIIKNDELFDSLIPILLKKVQEGVEVRILCDGMGGRFMPKKKWQELEDAGVKVGVFFPATLGRINLRVNYRNHRKIVVIDGRVGYVGGFNIGREYIGKDPKFGYWRDTHLKLHGDAVISLQMRFAQDWNYACKENLFRHAEYFDIPHSAHEERRKVLEGKRPPLGVQIISSGPDARDRQIRNNYLELFYKAKDHIYIQTPYFVPDDAVLSALEVAAKSGVDVRLMIPCKPDHPFVYWATYSYVGDLLDAGAKCYTYENGFLHAKGVMADGRVCSYGTANMDIRSFELNFEVNAVIYDEDTTEKLEKIFLEDLKNCREITRERYRQRSLVIRVKEQCSRLLSPLL